jgi:tRNA/rRNA methyltransferase
MNRPLALDRIRVVLSRTSHPGNIGAAARAMKTMGLRELWLVAPESFPDEVATARASGAADLLESMHGWSAPWRRRSPTRYSPPR